MRDSFDINGVRGIHGNGHDIGREDIRDATRDRVVRIRELLLLKLV
jgi:hypothetical protein